jgi:hypothetical protein
MRYPGGKGRCYQHLISLMPPHRTYIETHLGGGAVLRHKRPAETNIGLEKDEAVVERWGYCQLGAEEAKLPRAQPSRQSTSAHEGSPGRIAPGGEGVITRSPILTGGKTVTAELEVVVDRSVNGKELLCVPD